MIPPLTPPGDPGPADRWPVDGDLSSPCWDSDVLKTMQIVVQIALRGRLDRCFARQGSFKFFSGPVSLFFLVLFSFSVVLFSVSVVVFSFFLVRGGSMRNPRSVNNYQRQRQRTKRTSSLKS